MKLSDLDEIQRVKSAFLEATKQLQAMRHFQSSPAYCSLSLGSIGHADMGVVGLAVLKAAEGEMTKHHDALKAKLMLYGVDDFGEVK